MKVRLTIDLDIPSVEDYSDGELQQLVFDEYVNHATCAHFEDAAKWLAESNKKNSVFKKENCELIFKMHKTWGDICSNAKFKLEKIDD